MPSELEKFVTEIKNGNIQRIDLGFNNIGKEGAIALADMLRYNTTIREIYLSINNIGDDGAIALADMLRYNTSIREMHLWDNNIGEDNKQMLKKAAIDHPYIRKRLLSNNEATIFKNICKCRKISQRIATDISQAYCLYEINKHIITFHGNLITVRSRVDSF